MVEGTECTFKLEHLPTTWEEFQHKGKIGDREATVHVSRITDRHTDSVVCSGHVVFADDPVPKLISGTIIWGKDKSAWFIVITMQLQHN